MEESKLHVVLVPNSLQGRLIPFTELANLLASLGLTVSYITIPEYAQHLQAQVQSSNLDIQFVTLTPPPSEEPSPGTEGSGNVPGEEPSPGSEGSGNVPSEEPSPGSEGSGNVPSEERSAGSEGSGNVPSEEPSPGSEGSGNVPSEEPSPGSEGSGNVPSEEPSPGSEGSGNVPCEEPSPGSEGSGNVPSEKPSPGSEGSGNFPSEEPSPGSEGSGNVPSEEPSRGSEGSGNVPSEEPFPGSEGSGNVPSEEPSPGSEGSGNVPSEEPSPGSEGSGNVPSEEPSPESEGSGNVPSYVTPMEKMAGPFEEWLNNNADVPRTSPACIISDVFSTGWVHSSAARFGIPSVTFYTRGAYTLSVLHTFVTVCKRQNIPDGDDEIFEMPGLSFAVKLRMSIFPPYMRQLFSWLYIPLIEEIKRNRQKKQMILINTFDGIDSSGIDHLKSLTGAPVLNIGPLLPPAVFDKQGVDRGKINILRGKPADIDDVECLRWLDSQRPESVVFVSFGSMFIPSNQQIFALLAALEASGHTFIWAIERRRELKPEAPDQVPEGEIGNGLIIRGWAPQLLFLSHPSIGAFLTHCGWNSTLESISRGVPMITWPMHPEESLNSKLVVEDLNIATNLCVGATSKPDQETVKRALNMILAEQEGKNMRMRVQELRRLAKIAVNKDGASYNNLLTFIEVIKSKIGTTPPGPPPPPGSPSTKRPPPSPGSPPSKRVKV